MAVSICANIICVHVSTGICSGTPMEASWNATGDEREPKGDQNASKINQGEMSVSGTQEGRTNLLKVPCCSLSICGCSVGPLGF